MKHQERGSAPLIRHETENDVDAIHTLHAAAFGGELEAVIVDRLRDSGRLSLSLVAEVDGCVVGHVAFSPVSAAGAREGLGLAPVGVMPDCQRQGIGGRLIIEGLREALRRKVGFVVVIGEPRYYRRFGFTPASEWGLVDEYGAGEAFQVVEIVPGGIPEGGGRVRYAAEFDVRPEPGRTDGRARRKRSDCHGTHGA